MLGLIRIREMIRTLARHRFTVHLHDFQQAIFYRVINVCWVTQMEYLFLYFAEDDQIEEDEKG